MQKYIVHVHVWLFLKIVQLNSLIMSYVHQLGIWSSDYWLTSYSRRRKLNVTYSNLRCFFLFFYLISRKHIAR